MAEKFYWHEILYLIPVFLFIVLMICVLWRRHRSKKKVKSMCEPEKWKLLSELTKPFGFLYDPKEDIFISRLHAWQRREGYELLYDKLASRFNMIFDALPVYFDYENKTWLIEFWKGQYGINTGCEVGVYHTNRKVPEKQRKIVHYNAVSDEEMPLIYIGLEKKKKCLFQRKAFHWWLTGFRMGMFSNPEDLVLHARVSFLCPEAAKAFCQGLRRMGYPSEKYRLNCQTVSLKIDRTASYSCMERLRRKLVQCQNRIFCRLYKMVTYPFRNTADRMLFLYYQLPWCFRHMLRLHAFGRKSG